MAKPANSAEALAPPPALRSPQATRATLGASGAAQATCAPRESGAGPPRTLRAPRALGAQLRKLWNPGPMLGGGGSGRDAQLSTPSPGNPSYLQLRESPGPPISSPIPSPTIKTTSRPRDGGQARAGGAGLGSRLHPRASLRPRRPLGCTVPQPRDSPRQLPGSFVALARSTLWNARASASQARPPLFYGWGRDWPREGRGGARASASQAPGEARTRGSGDPATASGQEMGGNRGQ